MIRRTLPPGHALCSKCKGTGIERVRLFTPRQLLRRRAGFTVKGMAKRLNISAPYLSQFERGVRHGNAKIREAYAALQPPPKNGNGKNGKR